jgi:hypothetical protein
LEPPSALSSTPPPIPCSCYAFHMTARLLFSPLRVKLRDLRILDILGNRPVIDGLSHLRSTQNVVYVLIYTQIVVSIIPKTLQGVKSGSILCEMPHEAGHERRAVYTNTGRAGTRGTCPVAEPRLPHGQTGPLTWQSRQ